jgi:hypothetical protein
VHIAEPFAEPIARASERRDVALERLRELDPEWELPPSVRSTAPPTDIGRLVRSLQDEAQLAEARITVIERGGVPLGFNSREDFHEFGRTIFRGLNEAGYSDALPFMRGSAVTGYNYVNGRPFDGGSRPSDFDLAISSPTLLRRATEIGVQLRGQGSRTEPLRDSEVELLGLQGLRDAIGTERGRRATIMIYGSPSAVEGRGPFVRID